MGDNWQPPVDVKPWMVCAACSWQGVGPIGEGRLVLGARHWDDNMRMTALRCGFPNLLDWDQGFIDQWGRFYSREEAMAAVKASGQPFDIERNGGKDEKLYSEGLY